MEKQESKRTLSSFPTASTTTKHNYLWDTDSEGKVTLVALLLLIFFILPSGVSQPPVPRGADHAENGHGESESKEQSRRTTLEGTQPSPLGVEIGNSRTEQPTTDPHRDKCNQNPRPHWWEDPNWWVAGFTFLLGVVAIGQVVLFGFQLWIMKSSLVDTKTAADAAKVSADAAKQSADISINSERAWIIDEIRSPYSPPQFDPVIVTVTLSNQGRVPARITDLKINFRLVDVPEEENGILELPRLSEEQMFLELGTNGLILAPQRSEGFIVKLASFKFTPHEWLLLHESDPYKVRLFVYGRAMYYDGFTANRETRFCYVWDQFSGLVAYGPARFRRVGPSGYIEAT